MKNLGWIVESDIFKANTPIFGELEFENIIAKLNPNARRYLTLACHYDSKYTRERTFIGATDSAVPCAQLINLATVMNKYLTKDVSHAERYETSIAHMYETLEKFAYIYTFLQDVSLMFIFFDGEEAFEEWGPNDSIYGAKHLAKQWHSKRSVYEGEGNDFSELDRMVHTVFPLPIYY